MNSVLTEICRLAVTISSASSASIAYKRNDGGDVKVIAKSIGDSGVVDGRYALPLLSLRKPVLHVRDIDSTPELSNHPIHELIPHLKSVASYIILPDDEGYYCLAMWNPSSRYFDNNYSLAATEHLREVIRMMLKTQTIEEQITKAVVHDAEFHGGLHEPTVLLENEPAARFLFDTLVPKQRLLGRNGCSYLALRTWRKTIKPYQVDALVALKTAPSHKVVESIASEMSTAVNNVYRQAFQSVVPIPGGHSGKTESLSMQIARQVARNLKLEFANVLVPQQVSPGSSHPKKSTGLQPYAVEGKIKGNVLIVDDVATSGKHIEMATMAVRPHANYATGLVWLAD